MQVSRSDMMDMWRTMVTIRRFEERLAIEYPKGDIPGKIHLYLGQEAVATGVMAALEDGDKIASTHRGHGHAIAMGCDLEAMMQEIYGRAGGICGGKGGSQHIADLSKGMLGANGIVGANAPIVLGASLSAKALKTNTIAVSFMGDGACNQGGVMETLNMAAVLKVPMVIVVESNGYGQATPTKAVTAGEGMAARATAFGWKTYSVDGVDVFEVHHAMQQARDWALTKGPVLIEADVPRFSGHFSDDEQAYRPHHDGETSEANFLQQHRNCLELFHQKVTEAGLIDREVLDEIEADVFKEITAIHQNAVAAPLPDIVELTTNVILPESDIELDKTTSEKSEKMSIRSALNSVLHQAMDGDERIIVMGEDIAGGGGLVETEDAWGGPMGVTAGLLKKFGRTRVIDTPISETAFLGAAAGAALTGLRPVVELMFVDFMGVAFDQILNQAAKFHYMFGGRSKTPLVIRTTIGAGGGSGAQHSQTLYNMFTAVPGLTCVMPSNAYDAKGLLTTALKSDNPVVFFENKNLYDDEMMVPLGDYAIPFGKAKVVEAGSDLTIVAFSAMVGIAKKAANELIKQGISVEVIDPRTTLPLDEDAILESVQKTGHLVIVDESGARCGVAGDIAAMVADKGFHHLRAPIKQITPPHTPIPVAPNLEKAWLPSVQSVVDCVNLILNKD